MTVIGINKKLKAHIITENSADKRDKAKVGDQIGKGRHEGGDKPPRVTRFRLFGCGTDNTVIIRSD
ncbi:hypothetical protein CBW58_15440 [Yersinia frederiksenii]|nr:hypothetical protein CBW58_15440 [Yersinia frederiksenii]